MTQGIQQAKRSGSAVFEEASMAVGMHRYSEEVLGQVFKAKPRWVSDSDRLNRAKSALRHTMNQANKILETIKYFRSFHLKPCDVQDSGSSIYESVNQVLHAMSYEYPFRKITLVKMISKDLPKLGVPREHLDTIFFQLIYQARRAIGENSGIITIEAKEEVYLSAGGVSTRYFDIRVADTGASLSPDAVPVSEEQEGGEGGLGFYVIKRLVELNKGSFRAERHQRGNSFHIKFLASGAGGEIC